MDRSGTLDTILVELQQGATLWPSEASRAAFASRENAKALRLVILKRWVKYLQAKEADTTHTLTQI